MNCPNANSRLTNTHIINEPRDVVNHYTLCPLDLINVFFRKTCHARAKRLSYSQNNPNLLLDVTKKMWESLAPTIRCVESVLR